VGVRERDIDVRLMGEGKEKATVKLQGKRNSNANQIRGCAIADLRLRERKAGTNDAPGVYEAGRADAVGG
jgi:hypothetical protein